MTWNLTDGSLCQLRGISREAERRFRSDGIVDAEKLLQHLAVNGPVSLLRRVERNAETYRWARRLGLTDVMDLHEFFEPWKEAEIIVSFNGKRFDVPVLMYEFGISRIPAHLDLMDEGRYYGLKGKLKEVERRIGFHRAESCCRNGLDAIELWHGYAYDGDQDKLETLKTYNLNDVRSLVALYQHLLPLAMEGLSLKL